MWVGCWWCALDISPEHYPQCGLCRWNLWLTAASRKVTLCKEGHVGMHGCCCESTCHLASPGIDVDSQTIMNRVLLQGSYLVHSFPFCPYILPNRSDLPFWSRCTVIPLPSLHPHAHLLSVSHWATFWSRVRTIDEKESLFFNHPPLWSHLFILIISLPTFISRICSALM